MRVARDGLEPRSVAVGGKPRLLRSAGSMELCAGAHVATPSAAEGAVVPLLETSSQGIAGQHVPA